MNSIDQQPAYVLHSRNYRETSLLVDFLMPDFGRISAVVRGARRAKSPQRSLLQPFGRLLVSCYGKGELKTLTMLESDDTPRRLQGKALFSGLYLNELLVRLLKAEEPCETLFADYERAIVALASGQPLEAVLRAFEKRLLQALGYSLTFPEQQTPQWLYLSTDSQWVPLSAAPTREQQARCFRANELAAIAIDDYQRLDVLRAAKRLMRLALAPHLGSKPLRSKELFMQQQAASVQPASDKQTTR